MKVDDKEKALKYFYFMARTNPGDISSIIQKVVAYQANSVSPNERLFLSFVSLKNDLILQYDLREENIIKYKQDLDICFKNKLYLINEEIPFKFFEIIGKIQYANNLLHIVDENLKEVYDSFLLYYGKEMMDYFNNFISNPIVQDRKQLAFMHNIAFLFIPFFKNTFDPFYEVKENETFFEAVARVNPKIMDQLSINLMIKNIFLSIIFKFKGDKKNHYNMTWEEIEAEGFSRYDLIYKG